MTSNDDVKYVCERCVKDSVLHHWIEAEGDDTACSFCDNAGGPSVSIEQLAERIDGPLRQFYRPRPMEPHFSLDPDDDHGYWEQDGEEVQNVLEENCGVEYEVAVALADALSASESYDDGDDAWYGRYTKLVHIDPVPTAWRELWAVFELRIKHHRRFFDPKADKYLRQLIGDLATLRGGAALLRIGPGTEHRALYRARVAASDDEARMFVEDPLTHLVPPPRATAAPGRMNPAGISVFYGAFSSTVCVAEVRPPVGGVAVVARFHLVRPLTLLDLSYFGRTFYAESTFSPEYGRMINRLQFLRELQARLSRPVTPRDESLEYLPTQAVAEFISRRMKLDGLVYNSSQIGAAPNPRSDGPDLPLFRMFNKQPVAQCNVALFGPAGRIGRARSSEPEVENRTSKEARHALECDVDEPEPRRVSRIQLSSHIDYSLYPPRTIAEDENNEIFPM